MVKLHAVDNITIPHECFGVQGSGEATKGANCVNVSVSTEDIRKGDFSTDINMMCKAPSVQQSGDNLAVTRRGKNTRVKQLQANIVP